MMYDAKTKAVFESIANDLLTRLETVSKDWSKPWFTPTCKGAPQTLEGRPYSFLNSLSLLSTCEKHNYRIPVFMTFNHAQSIGCAVMRGQKSTPVLFSKPVAVPVDSKAGLKSLTLQEYKALSEASQKEYKVMYFYKVHYLFNIDQTNYRDVYKEKYETLEKKFSLEKAMTQDASGMTRCEVLDTVLEKASWLCPIRQEFGSEAYYSISQDLIAIPEKGQFKTGEDFYETMLHEMAHSTGSEKFLNRHKPTSFGSKDYAIEELIAECFAATKSMEFGFSPHIKEDARAYLKIWMDSLREKPADLMRTILTQTSRINTLFNEKVGIKEISAETESAADKSASVSADSPVRTTKNTTSKTSEKIAEKTPAKSARSAKTPKVATARSGQKAVAAKNTASGTTKLVAKAARKLISAGARDNEMEM